MFERFTDGARRVVVIAQGEARDLGHPYIGTEHLLLGLLGEPGGLAAQALGDLGVSADDIRATIKQFLGPPGVSPSGFIPFTPRVKDILHMSLREALQLGYNYIGTEHLLLAIIREGNGSAIEALRKAGVEPIQVRQQVLAVLSGYRFDELVTDPSKNPGP